MMKKASGSDGIPVELFQILKDDAAKVLRSICQYTNMPDLESSAVATGLKKVCFHSNPQNRQCKECSNDHTIAVISC